MNNQNMENGLLFIYTETPLHAGSGRALGAVDLPIQRERVTDYPMIQSSSLKGRLRAEMRNKHDWEDDSEELAAIFGKADGESQSYAGAIAPGDARLLLFPVRSLQGVFAWITSRDVLSRFQRDATAMGISVDWKLPDEPKTTDKETECYAGEAVTFKNNQLSQVTLEEFTYVAKTHPTLQQIGGWLAENALPQNQSEYKYWRDNLTRHLVILPREDFRDFTRYGTEVRTHVRIAPDTKTVQAGALWTVESLPSDTLLYAPMVISDSRAQVNTPQKAGTIAEILRKVLHDQRTHLGGDETTGHGVVMLHFCGSKEVKNG